jgi:peptidoglycan lytic transglycosylase
MFPPASSSQYSEKSIAHAARRGRPAITFAMAIVFWVGMVWDQFETCYGAPIMTASQGAAASQGAVLTLANVPASNRTNVTAPAYADVQPSHTQTCAVTAIAALSQLDLQAPDHGLIPAPAAPKSFGDVLNAMESALTNSGPDKIDLAAYAGREMWPGIVESYRSALKQVAILKLPQIEEYAALTDGIYIGIASTYSPNHDGTDFDPVQTASGERYDAAAWTAAIQIDLRDRFGGVRFGALYQPAFALIEGGGKRAIVKINDVGPLKPGRVIDLNVRSMHYFDPTLERGLVPDVRITILPGKDWTPGPVDGIEFAEVPSTPGPSCETCASILDGNRDAAPAILENRYGSNFLNTASN